MDASPSSPRTARHLVVAAVLLVVATGGLLWWRVGGAVFTDLVSGALAWCF